MQLDKDVKLGSRVINRYVSVTRILPNVVTLIGLVVGVGSIRFALDEKWEFSVYCVIISSIIDGLDGKIARILNATSTFGAELDSLCDFVNFGLIPALLMYLWSFQQYEYKVISWCSIMFFIVCMGIRLARFNDSLIKDSKNDNKIKQLFSVGVPAPAGALLILIPIMLDFELAPLMHFSARNYTLIIDLYIFVIALLLASTLPTISLKNLRIKSEYLSIAMMSFSFLFITLIVYPWYFFPVLAVIYLSSIIWCMCYKKKLLNAQ